MQVIEQEFTVRYSFPVFFTRNVFDETNSFFAELFNNSGSRRHRVLAFVDSGVISTCPSFVDRVTRYAGIYADFIDLAATPVMIQGGEQCKNDPSALEQVRNQIEKNHLCRQSFVLAIGGGALLDVVGYGAATVHRGIRLIRMPTTVLAQNDAGVGVKNGINGFGRKNFLGTFAPPFAVINDFSFLSTLSERELRAGIVEAVKVSLIKDADFFDTLFRERRRLATFERDAMENMVYRCAALHIDHIGSQGDPFETGSSRPLDFGHWTAHKLEEITHNTINHGEAVAIGIGLDSLYAFHRGMINRTELDAIFTLFADLHLDLYHPALSRIDVTKALLEFQEHLGGELTVTLPLGIGNRTEVHSIDAALMYRCIEILAENQKEQRINLDNLPAAPLSSRLSIKAVGSKTSYMSPAIINAGTR